MAYAPPVWRLASVLFVLAACDSPDPTDDSVACDVPTGMVEGRVRYEDRVFDRTGFTGELALLPARNVRVALVDDTGATIIESDTDGEGRFTLPHCAPADARVTVRAFAAASVGVQRLRVVDNALDVHAVESAPADASADVELVAEADAGIGGAFNILDVASTGLEFLASRLDTAGPRLTLHWEAGQEMATRYSTNDIYLGGQVEDTDEYDDDIILHELAHYVVESFVPAHAIGGLAHRDRQVSPAIAYGEGSPYFFAAMVQGRSWYIDTFADAVRLIDLEPVTQNGATVPELSGTTTGGLCGDLREEVVAAILWDAFDAQSAAEPFDIVEIGVEGYLQIFFGFFGTWPHPDQGAPGPELADFLFALETELGVPAAAVQQLADNHGFPTMVDDCGP